MVERPDSDQVVLSPCHHITPVGTPTDAGDPSKVATHPTVELSVFEVIDSHKSVLTRDGYVFGIGGESETIDSSVTDGPTIEERRLVLALDRRDGGVL